MREVRELRSIYLFQIFFTFTNYKGKCDEFKRTEIQITQIKLIIFPYLKYSFNIMHILIKKKIINKILVPTYRMFIRTIS